MKWIAKTIFIAALATGVMACGGEEQADKTQCGDNTEPNEEGVCEPTLECEEGEVKDAQLGLCVRAGDDYCGEGTEFDDTFGRCVAEAYVQCAEDTVEEDGECIPAVEKSCGPGTVAVSGECVPDDEVCAGDTELDSDEDICRPVEGICGEGTTFDVAERHCIPTSTLECGPGTTVTGEMDCIPTGDFYDQLAEDVDLDMSAEDGVGQISLADTGERFVFKGIIDEPKLKDGELIQQQDIFSVDAEAGQWLRLGLYSKGLPEPGFEFRQKVDAEPFWWRSDLAQGVEVRRQLLIPVDDTYELKISNIPHMLDDSLPAAGGEDWGYVGFVETMESPEPQNAEVPGDVEGDIRHLSQNFYAFEDMAQTDSLGLLFDTLPSHAESYIHIWSDETTLEKTHTLDEVLSFEVPADSFLAAFDYTHAFGDHVHYSASIQEGTSLEPGQSITEEVTLEPGDYVGLFQDNLEDEALSATIRADGQVVAETDELRPLISEEGKTSLYWYVPMDESIASTAVELEVHNSTGSTLDFVSSDYTTGSSDLFTGIDGTPAEFQYDQPLSRGHRHYVRLEIETDELLRMEMGLTSPDARLTLFDAEGNQVIEGFNLLVIQDEEQRGDYVLAVEAAEEMPDGFSIGVQETEVIELSETSEPGVEIPENTPSGVDDSIEVSGCNTVADINMDVVIEHTWRGDLVVRLTNPAGESRVLKSRPGGGFFGDSSDDIIGNFNETLDPATGEPAVETAEPIDGFNGSAGNGEWTINVSDNAPSNAGGQLVSWTLNLSCDG